LLGASAETCCAHGGTKALLWVLSRPLCRTRVEMDQVLWSWRVVSLAVCMPDVVLVTYSCVVIMVPLYVGVPSKHGTPPTCRAADATTDWAMMTFQHCLFLLPALRLVHVRLSPVAYKSCSCKTPCSAAYPPLAPSAVSGVYKAAKTHLIRPIRKESSADITLSRHEHLS
jgi:hypothetical protein